MQKKITLLLIAILFAGAIHAQNYFYGENFIAADEAKSHSKIQNFHESKMGDNYDLKHLRFNLYIDPDTLYIKGCVTSSFVTTVNNVSQIHFELSYLLTVDSVLFHGNHAAFTHSGDDLSINLGTSYNQYHFDSVSVFYRGVPSAGLGFGSFIKDYHNGTPIIWTLSEPYGTKDWWPCKNSLSDKIDSMDMIVTTPAQYRAGSNGLLVEEYISGTDKVYHWKHRYPIAAYLIGVAVTNYAYYYNYAVDNGDSIKILNYVYPEELATWQTYTPGVVTAMNIYDSLFGTYPFIAEKYGHAQFNWGGGMEHQTMTFLINSSFDLMAHELAHQWYGDKVTCSSWHDIWVNESFATYCTGLCFENMQSGYWWPIWKKNQLNSIISDTGGSVYCYDTTSVARVFDGRLSYSKGAMVLHMLRWKIGDVAFFQAMRGLLNDPQHAFGFASTEDVRQHFEAASGQSLSGYFDDWIYKEGYPIYTINCMALQDSSITLTINQAQSHSSVSYFDLPVPIEFKNSQKDTIIVFNNSFSGQMWGFNLGFVPDSVKFDPEQWLIAKLDTLLVTKVEHNEIPDLKIFPNPVHDRLELVFPEPGAKTIELYDATGHLVYSTSSDTYIKKHTINMLSYASGNYYVKTSINNNKVTYKIVKD